MKKKRATFRTVDIFKTPPSAAELRELCRKLGLSTREILRKKDPLYAEMQLESGRHTDAQLFELMARHPGLIQRPIIVRGTKAVIARPAEEEALLE